MSAVATLRVAAGVLASVPVARMAAARALHCSAVRGCISQLAMPIPYPDMTEGDIAKWKMKEGDAFHVGDVLLEIETDKTMVDVEAQRDGVVGKIIVPDGYKRVRVGKVLALLADEGDDISRLELPAQPIFPSVRRLLAAHRISPIDAAAIPGTGTRGMLTKGDVLAFVRAREAQLEAAREAKERALAVIDRPSAIGMPAELRLTWPSWLLAALRMRALGEIPYLALAVSGGLWSREGNSSDLTSRLLTQARRFWPPRFPRMPTNPPAASL
ncbi:single hybrid motif-containing protein [Schizophyllum commune H4-8]|nr:single hybrid motif-containing protein [Schizophyllum commune H4-8]KAI5899086.1 single hybrid motif-containing protein [Schizophyllum commune H4-8]